MPVQGDRRMTKPTRHLWRLLEAAVLTAFAVMVVLVIAQVFFRYILQVSVPWTEEAARWIYAWQIFLGSALAARRGLHLRATFLLDRFPSRLRAVVDFAIGLAGLLFLAGIVWGALIMMRATYGVEAGSFPVSTSYLYLAIPVSLAIMLALTARDLLRDCAAFFRQDRG
jgi:TRAP-type C4-dicarboxylate transport system permease small subunit